MGDAIDLERTVEGLESGQVIIVCGKLEAEDEETVSEIAIIDRVIEVTTNGDEYSTLELTEELEHEYERSTVVIRANVVHATHGETVSEEVLGSGDASKPFQHFTLKKDPLTHVSAATASGSEAALSVRVDGLEWEKKESLFGLTPSSRSYAVRISDDTKATVQMGDGQSGARLSTGPENVHATYRFGIGVRGNVRAGSLILLKKKPYGIKRVDNPVKASGGGDAEQLAGARENAPVTVLTLDRIVSLRDFEDFARTFAGIGKAASASLQIGQTQLVHVTIGASDGSEVDDTTDLYKNLFDAIASARDPLLEFRLDSFERRTFKVGAEVIIDETHEWEPVRLEIESALLNAFSFAERGFGQSVSAAQITQIVQGVQGVTAIDLNELYLVDANGDRVGDLLSMVLLANIARENPAAGPGIEEILPAEILVIDESGISLLQMIEDSVS